MPNNIRSHKTRTIINNYVDSKIRYLLNDYIRYSVRDSTFSAIEIGYSSDFLK